MRFPFPDLPLSHHKISQSPDPSILTSTTSPGLILPMPDGVPVAITSPGSKVITSEIKLTTSSNPKIMSLVRADCLSLSVQISLKPQVIRVDIGQSGPYRGEGVITLGPRPLAIRFLHMAFRDIVNTGVTQDIIPDPVLWHILRLFADNNAQFTLVVHARRIARQNNLIVGPYDRSGWFEEDEPAPRAKSS